MSNGRGLIPYSLFTWPREQFENLENYLSNWEGVSFKDIQIDSDEKNIYVSVPIPGIDISEVEISLHNGTLYIKAEHKEEKKEKTKERRTHLQATRSYSRVITLPERVDENKVSATAENGLLNIQLPKITRSEAKKVPIKKK